MTAAIDPGSRRLLAQIKALASSPDDEWTGLPPGAYHSQAVFDAEAEHVFLAGWILIGRVDQAANPGDFLCVDVLGESLVMVRDQQGELRVLSRTCRHRWMDICNGAVSGNCEVFVCPYHAWTYELDGRLRGATEMHRTPHFEAGEVRLAQIRHEVWQGFVFVNLDGRADALAPRLAPLDEAIAEYELESWVTVRSLDFGEQPWDWKVMMDNGEVYHHLGLHRHTVEPRSPGRLGITEQNNGHFGLQYGPAAEGVLVTGSDGKPVMPAYLPRIEGYEPWLRLNHRQRTSALYLYVLPNYVISLNPDRGAFVQTFPLGPGRIHYRQNIMVPPEALTVPDFEAALDTSIERAKTVIAEDFLVCEAVQRGAQSQFATQARLSHLETHQRDFARWVARQLVAFAPESKS